MTHSEKVEGRNVSLYPSDWLIVETADIGRAGVSATLRRIVREWNASRHSPTRLVDSPEPYEVNEAPEPEPA